MTDDPPRLRLDPETPGGLSELMAHGAPPPRLDAATKAASAAAVATLAGGTAAAATTAATTAVGAKVWLVVGGLVLIGFVAGGIVNGVGMGPSEAPDATASEPPATAHRTEATPEGIEAPPEVPPATEQVSEEPPASVEPLPARAAPRRARRPGRADPPAVRSGGGLVAEAALLEEARGLLARDPAAALAATERHRREHPRAQLAAEREFIAIDALRRLGRNVPARRRAQRLIERSPSGIYAERARAILRDLPQ